MIVAFALLTGREMLQQKRSRIAKNLARASGLPLLVRLIAFFSFCLLDWERTFLVCFWFLLNLKEEILEVLAPSLTILVFTVVHLHSRI